MSTTAFWWTLFLLFGTAFAHHDDVAWRFYHHGIMRAFFGGFFSTLFIIIGVLAFYHVCLRGGAWGRLFPLFPRKPIIPLVVPFANAPSYMGTDRPETLVLTAATSTSTPPSVFYSNVHSTSGNLKTGFPGYNV